MLGRFHNSAHPGGKFRVELALEEWDVPVLAVRCGLHTRTQYRICLQRNQSQRSYHLAMYWVLPRPQYPAVLCWAFLRPASARDGRGIYLRIPKNKRATLRTQLVSTTDARCRCSHSSRLHDNSTPSKHIKIGNMYINHSKSAAKAIHVHIKGSMLRRFSAWLYQTFGHKI